MKNILISFLIILAFIIAVPTASMAGNHYGHYKHHNGYHYNHGPYVSGNFYYGPSYYPRPYVYYAPPPPPPVVYYAPAPYPFQYYPSVSGSLTFGIHID